MPNGLKNLYFRNINNSIQNNRDVVPLLFCSSMSDERTHALASTCAGTHHSQYPLDSGFFIEKNPKIFSGKINLDVEELLNQNIDLIVQQNVKKQNKITINTIKNINNRLYLLE